MNDEIYNLCIMGTGPAGLIVAMEYAHQHPQEEVVLIEYGKENTTRNSLDDSIDIKQSANHHPAYECTNKGFGGTTSSWGGRCVTYDEVDFTDRPVIRGNCTWDTELFREVNTFLPKAAFYLDCGEPVFNLDQKEAHKNRDIAEGFIKGTVTDNVVERWSLPTRFREKFRKTIQENQHVTLLEGWEARNFDQPDIHGEITYVETRNSRGQFKRIKAQKFVVACGAQETTRLLLKNPGLFKNLSQVPEALGKYYQGHVSGKIASVRFSGNPRQTEFGFIRDERGVYLRRRFQFSKEHLVKNDLLNTAIWLDNPLYHDPGHRSGAMSLMYLMMITPGLGRRLAPPAIRKSITSGQTGRIRPHLLNVIRDLPGSLLKPAGIFWKRYLHKRTLPGVFLYNPKNEYALHFHSEQVPRKENRMQLAGDGETLEIHYSLSDDDINSVIKLHRDLDAWLQKCHCGKLTYWYSEDERSGAIRRMSKDGLHQVGTTRIAKAPDKGVVDRDLRVFGCRNLFLCTSAVFPTSGQANPTLYLCAFAVRLARFLGTAMHVVGPNLAKEQESPAKDLVPFSETPVKEIETIEPSQDTHR